MPVPVTGRKFAGSESARNGINGLAIAEDVTMVVVPDLITAATKADGTVDLNLWKAVQTALISHCEQNGNRMAVLDAPPGMNPQQIKEWRSETAMYDSAYAALYYPWIKVENPIGVNGNNEVYIPPSGHIAGVWARTDETRGVWKAPANDTIRGVLDIERAITQNEQSLLNPIGINCIRPVRHPGHPHLGRPHPRLGHRLALHQRPPAVQHDRGDDPRGHPVRRIRAERRDPVGRA